MSPSDIAVVVVARWQMAAESLGGVLALVAELRRRSLEEEPGCLGYEVYEVIDEPGVVVLIERYRGGAALDTHRRSVHYREILVDRILPMLTARRVELLRQTNVE